MNSSPIVYSRFLNGCHFIMKLAYLNLLWMSFTIIGLGLFGIFPATIAVLCTVRKWNIGKENSIWTDFICSFKREFLKSNLYGWCGLFITAFIVIGLHHLIVSFQHYVYYLIIACVFILLIISIYLPFLYIHYQLSFISYMKTGFVLTFSYPHFTILIVCSLLFCYMLFMAVPGLIPFFFISLPAWMTVSVSHFLFNKLETAKMNEQSRISQ
ncbi:YesL family protein [Gracilibacillus sp. HCP3S3_G5_1]|uniref:YesL family protein n=1 Tax=unclassified Gracilibacillus TaxID=2625209 RepID=UPI003F8B5461